MISSEWKKKDEWRKKLKRSMILSFPILYTSLSSNTYGILIIIILSN